MADPKFSVGGYESLGEGVDINPGFQKNDYEIENKFLHEETAPPSSPNLPLRNCNLLTSYPEIGFGHLKAA